ncbi:hypothetical protein BDV37DRAFT_242527, partial [Aspergillus pseudonomiae]
SVRSTGSGASGARPLGLRTRSYCTGHRYLSLPHWAAAPPPPTFSVIRPRAYG